MGTGLTRALGECPVVFPWSSSRCPTPLGRPEPCWAPYGHGRVLVVCVWGVLLPPRPTSMPSGLLSWEGDRQMGSTLGSEQRFQAAPRFVPEMYASRPMYAHTHTHPPSFVHIHTHLSLKNVHFL